MRHSCNCQNQGETPALRTHRVEEARDDPIGIDAVGLGLEVHEDAVPQDRQRDIADVLDGERRSGRRAARAAFPPRRSACPARGPCHSDPRPHELGRRRMLAP